MKLSYVVDVEVPTQLLRDLLITALEGGSNYWYHIHNERTKYPAGVTYADFREGGRFTDPQNYAHPLEIIPFTDGCSICIEDKMGASEEDEEGPLYWLGISQLLEGIKVMANKFPRHFHDAVNETFDAVTGDVYLQCCLFGDVVYG